MTLRLVDNVVPLPGCELTDMEAAAQGFADAVPELNLTSALVVTVDDRGIVDFVCLGEQVTTSVAIGLLELVKAKIIAGAFK